VNTPDPRQEDPKTGERLAVSWEFPRSLFQKKLELHVTIRFWDNTEETFIQPIMRRRDFAVFFFPAKIQDKRRILTYQVRAISEEGEIVGSWEHPFWVPLIEIGDSSSAAKRRSSSVSSHERQGSVTDTP